MDNNFHAATPIFRVSNLAESIEYFKISLGFHLEWQSDEHFASVSRGDAHIMLTNDEQSSYGAWAYIGVGDVQTLYHEIAPIGADVVLPPRNFPWAMEIHVTDLDSNIIRFGSAPDKNREFDTWELWKR